MNPRHAAAAAVLMMTASIVVETQTATNSARLPAFEVATVKWHKSDAPRNFWLDPGGRLTITGFTLRDLIRIAYGSDESKLQRRRSLSVGRVGSLLIASISRPRRRATSIPIKRMGVDGFSGC